MVDKRFCKCSNTDCCVASSIGEGGCTRTDKNIPGVYFCNYEMGEEQNLMCGDCVNTHKAKGL